MGSKYILILFILLACSKKDKQLGHITFDKIASNSLSLLPNQISKKIDRDSVILIEGQNKHFKIKGCIDKKSKKRIGWWTGIDLTNNKNTFSIEYILLDNNKLEVNQLKIYHNGKLDTLNSLFYTFEQKGNLLQYQFYTPQTKGMDFFSAKFFYNNNKIKFDSFSNPYKCEVLLPKSYSKNYFYGLFSESYVKSNKALKNKYTLAKRYIDTKDSIR